MGKRISSAYILFLIKTAVFFLLRSKRTSMVLAFMIFASVATMVFLSALAEGTSDAMIRNSVGLFSGHVSLLSHENFSKKDLKNFSEAKVVLKRKIVKGVIRSSYAFRNIELTGVTPEEERQNTGLYKKTIEGEYLKLNSDEIYLGYTLAESLKVKKGDKVSFSSGKETINFKICGIFKTGLTEFDNFRVFCDINRIDSMDGAFNGAVFLKGGDDAKDKAEKLKTFMPRAFITSWHKMMPDLEQLIELNRICMAILIVIVFTIVSISIASAFMIFVLKNLREYGIMKVMGLSSFETVFLIYTKIIILIVFAAGLGVFSGYLLTTGISETGIDISSMTSHNRYFLISGVIYPRLTLEALIYPPLSALLFCLVTGLFPAFTVGRSRMSEILRSV